MKILLLVLALLLVGCTSRTPVPPNRQLEHLQIRMTEGFGGLELYAAEHAGSYPDDWNSLVPKYLDTLPLDPKSDLPLLYQKTASGYLIKPSADYRHSGASPGFPQMDQDGFFALAPDDFPSAEYEQGTKKETP